MAKYKVTKIKVDRENSDRFIKEGYVCEGEVTGLQVGERMEVLGHYGIITSPVEKIEPTNGENLLVKTRNSTYSLEKINE